MTTADPLDPAPLVDPLPPEVIPDPAPPVDPAPEPVALLNPEPLASCELCPPHLMLDHDEQARCMVILDTGIPCPCGLPPRSNPTWPWAPQ